ncbi:hypothetical protein M3T53_09160 [Actinomyces sp. B33]|uniref:hypothetical protein n=1 Tax=Actinomyces sp. B33 TaxID=2942131 RepID=UPI00234156D7|nr:hypothetical protein [Actinomyces sp. B33]MDC4233867.1 hypothetical protein [Actinomyces sp. B33]
MRLRDHGHQGYLGGGVEPRQIHQSAQARCSALVLMNDAGRRQHDRRAEAPRIDRIDAGE